MWLLVGMLMYVPLRLQELQAALAATEAEVPGTVVHALSGPDLRRLRHAGVRSCGCGPVRRVLGR
ncbi:MAG TPA: hypothetical protein VFQ11_07955, partial [Nocardioidaceae bacterium]|nr:hypothetical protein [Nocardioidaceae bacterium]